MKILLATKNRGKIREMQALLSEYIGDLNPELVSLSDVGFEGDIIEDGTTFEENALIKARAGAAFSGLITIADDSGLSAVALGGAPGIYSARYADDEGFDHDDEANNRKLLRELSDKSDRTASYVAAIACVFPEGAEITGEPIVTRGEVTGRIIDERRGSNGFGYDPYFYYEPFGCTFAEASQEQKGTVSHRFRAVKALAEELSKRFRGR